MCVCVCVCVCVYMLNSWLLNDYDEEINFDISL